MADQTVTELIKASLRKCGVIATGETPTDAEMQDALTQLRAMLRQWSADSIRVYAKTIITHSLDGSTSYTIGSGADIDTTRPVQITSAYVNSGGVDYPVKIKDAAWYARIHDKDLGATIPNGLWYNPGYPTGTIYVWWPGGGTLTLQALVPLQDPTTLTEDMALPGEYDQAIIWNLANLMMPEYGREPTSYMERTAMDALNTIETINAALAVEESELDILDATFKPYHINEG